MLSWKYREHFVCQGDKTKAEVRHREKLSCGHMKTLLRNLECLAAQGQEAVV